jgi:hypothetical protein
MRRATGFCKRNTGPITTGDLREKPAEPQDYHCKAPSARELEQMFCLEAGRSIANDWVVRYGNRYFQLERHSDYPPRQAKAMCANGRTNGSRFA